MDFMTQKEEDWWRTCTQPESMLVFVADRTTNRKLRLFAVACCRRLWHLLPNDCRQALEVAERFTDGHASEEERQNAADAVLRRGIQLHSEDPAGPPDSRYSAVYAALDDDDFSMLNAAAGAANHAAFLLENPESVSLPRISINEIPASNAKECCWQCDVLRCIVGCRPLHPNAFDPAWRSTTVMQLALHIYEQRAFEHMPILSDALIDAGCTDQDIIDHCRASGPHGRGCWVVDLSLARK